MNWKNKCAALALFISASTLLSPALAITADQYQRYEHLRQQMLEAPKDALPAIIQFQQRMSKKSPETRLMAGSLHLEACMQLKDNHCALAQADQLLDIPLEPLAKLRLLRLASWLNFEQESYPVAVQRIQQWLQTIHQLNKPKIAAAKNKKAQALLDQLAKETRDQDFAEQLTLLAYSHYYLKQYSPAINYIQQALEREPKRSRYQLLLVLYQKTEDLNNENQLLQQLAEIYPEQKNYWQRLAQTWLLLKSPEKALNTLSSAYKLKLLDQKNQLQYAQLLLQQGLPARAAQVLETSELKSDSKARPVLINAYLASFQRDKALALLEQQAIADPKAQSKILQKSLKIRSQLAYSLGKWQQAADLLAEQRLQEPENDYWHLLQAVSHYELKDYQKARALFQQLAAKDNPYKSSAEQWIKQIDYLSS